MLELEHIRKSFGKLPVLDDVSFSLGPGEVVGIAGKNGAGKTMLLSVIAGLEPPDEGHIRVDRVPLSWPFCARALGIEFIPQSPVLADDLDVTGNIFLGQEIGWPARPRWLRVPNRRRMDELAEQALATLEAHIPSLRERVAYLSAEQRQLVAIARVLIRPARLILVDDPTALLSTPYQRKLLHLIEQWRDRGTAVLFASNDLDHLFAVTDRILVLRDGRIVMDVSTDETTREEVVAAIVGMRDRGEVTPIIWAVDSYYRAREEAEKLQHQQRLLEKNLAAQALLREQLLEQLSLQIAALDKANRALQEAQRRLLTEREQERKHLARELHDQVIQDLLSINYQLEDLAEAREVPESVKADLARVREDIRGLVTEVRRICGDLRPPTIDSLGLGAAIRSYAREWQERTGIHVRVDIEDALGRLPEPIELSLFRIVQEGLNNVWKHAQATEVELRVYHPSPRMIAITLADNGQGLPEDFDLAAASRAGHYGLLGISERVALLGGRLSLKNRPGGGLLLHVEVPHPRPLREGI
ncbi:MAG: ATP-binding cassette domain-containing protein [Chloroflexi bacterium]|nr:ATP-binding cassette domain-containing protein [Chloroflexota bacterium]